MPRKPSIKRPPLPLPRKPGVDPQSYFKCEGGPYAGAELSLVDGTTTVFTAKGQYGRYVRSGAKRCVWESMRK